MKCDLCEKRPSFHQITAVGGQHAEVCSVCCTIMIAGDKVTDPYGFSWYLEKGRYYCRRLTPCMEVVIHSGSPDPDCDICKGTGYVPGTENVEFDLPALKCSCTWVDVRHEPKEVALHITTEV